MFSFFGMRCFEYYTLLIYTIFISLQFQVCNLQTIQQTQVGTVQQVPVAPQSSVIPNLPITFDAAKQLAGSLMQSQASTDSNSQIKSNGPSQEISSNLPIAASDDPIIYLDYTSIRDSVLQKSTANFVFFNANFNTCRHCSGLFNIWKELALDIRWWKQVVNLFAINCSEEDNIEICKKAGVTQFPQVRFYWIMSNSLSQDGQRLKIIGKSVHALRHLITDKIMESYVDHMKALAQRKKAQVSSSDALGTSPLTALLSPMLGQSLSNIGLDTDNLKSMTGLLTNLGIGDLANLGRGDGLSRLITTMLSPNNLLPRQRSNLQPIPSNWPELEPIEARDSQHLISQLPLKTGKGNFGALLIMETQEFLYNGIEVMLDLSPYSSLVYVARVHDHKSQLTRNMTKRSDIQAPALVFITPNKEPKLIATSPKYTDDEDLRQVFVRGFERRQVKYPVKRVWLLGNSNHSMSKTDEKLANEAQNETHQVHMSDLTNTLRSSLTDQVFRHPDINDDQHNALVKYVYAVINFFPFQNEETKNFLKRLHIWLQNQVPPIDIGDYKKQFHDIDEYIPKREWMACKSMASSKSIPGSSKKFNSVIENPAQIGKMVSNIRRMIRNQQQQGGPIGNFLNSMSATMSSPESTLEPPISSISSNNLTMKHNTTSSSQAMIQSQNTVTNHGTPTTSSPKPTTNAFIERIIKALLRSPLSSESSVLKLIATTLYGGKDFSSDEIKSAKFVREYPCGAWKLAHVMVVNEYLKESPRKDVRHIAIHGLNQYMLNFFSCQMCGNRVTDVNNEFRYNLEDYFKDQSDSIMLLWKAHNRINKRLESENRPNSLPKIQFPSETLCPKCRIPRAQGELTTTPNWQERQVLSFLIHHYRPQSIVTKDFEQNASVGSLPYGPFVITISICFTILVIEYEKN